MTVPAQHQYPLGDDAAPAGHHTRAVPPSVSRDGAPPPSVADADPVRLPPPIERFDIAHPDLPASLDGLRVLHLTDTHVRTHPAPARSPVQRALPAVLEAVERHAPPDIACFTGDAMDQPEDIDHALPALAELLETCAPRLGWLGVFGNHDTPDFQRRAADLPDIRWLKNEHQRVSDDLTVVGASEPEDLFAAALSMPMSPPSTPSFTLALAHFPPQIYPAARLGFPLLLAGHTHGGQIRLGPSAAPHTSCDLGPGVGSGVLRLGNTLCAISRGAGETVLDLRINCPPQVGLYTLRKGPLPGGDDTDDPPRLRQVIAW